ncbi:TRAP transporter small permease [Salibacterium salarium]|uniref:TRAP transporter small permease n=1 Tax=Salibacterium salarium TaxID=284579 RepID=A0A3R9PII4_9BACI|nr:TRAP transporter small permease [Salibacterium salarium]RSL31437.1 TRAP transporter small permease [Salibacterium salarium]
MNALRKGLNIFYKAEEVLLGILIAAATAVLFANVVLRYGFAANTSWANELVRYIMIWITFIGMGLCFRRGIHVGIDLLMNYLSKKATKVVQVIVNLLSISFLLFLGLYGLELVLFSIDTGQITPSLEIGMFWVYVVIPLGCALSIFHICMFTGKILSGSDELSLNNYE